jgi:hypothetical protein
LALKVPSGFCEDRKPVFLSTPSKRPDVTVWVIGSSLRQVTVVPTFTVVVEGLNISELRLITGPAGADVVAVGAVIDDSAFALQPARAPAVMSSEAAATTSLRRTGRFPAISTPGIRHGGIHGWVFFKNDFRRSENRRSREYGTNPKRLGLRTAMFDF